MNIHIFADQFIFICFLGRKSLKISGDSEACFCNKTAYFEQKIQDLDKIL